MYPDGTGYAGDFIEMPGVVDYLGNFVCDCADVETAQQIVREHNSWRELYHVCRLAISTLDDDAPGPGTTESDLLTQLRAAVKSADEQEVQ